MNTKTSNKTAKAILYQVPLFGGHFILKQQFSRRKQPYWMQGQHGYMVQWVGRLWSMEHGDPVMFDTLMEAREQVD